MEGSSGLVLAMIGALAVAAALLLFLFFSVKTEVAGLTSQHASEVEELNSVIRQLQNQLEDSGAKLRTGPSLVAQSGAVSIIRSRRPSEPPLSGHRPSPRGRHFHRIRPWTRVARSCGSTGGESRPVRSLLSWMSNRMKWNESCETAHSLRPPLHRNAERIRSLL